MVLPCWSLKEGATCTDLRCSGQEQLQGAAQCVSCTIAIVRDDAAKVLCQLGPICCMLLALPCLGSKPSRAEQARFILSMSNLSFNYPFCPPFFRHAMAVGLPLPALATCLSLCVQGPVRRQRSVIATTTCLSTTCACRQASTFDIVCAVAVKSQCGSGMDPACSWCAAWRLWLLQRSQILLVTCSLG